MGFLQITLWVDVVSEGLSVLISLSSVMNDSN